MASGDAAIHALFDAYRRQDKTAANELLTPDFTFTSPNDDHIGKAAYFERCWPNIRWVRSFNLETLAHSGDQTFVQYKCITHEGKEFRNTELFTLRAGKIKEVTVYFGATLRDPAPSPEAQIHAVIEARAAAVRIKDIESAMAAVAPDVLAFDVVDPLYRTGAASLRQRTEEWFGLFTGPIGFEMRDLHIAAATGIAFSTSLNRYSGTQRGHAIDMWVRVTSGYRQIAGKWLLTHEHSSVPFNVETGKPSLDLKP